MDDFCGVINVYKEKDYTSQDVCSVVRKHLNRVKAGHTGTLDPNAEGILPICLGKATKIADYLMAQSKRYKAQVFLGKTTDTEDITGTVITEKEVTSTKSEITQVVSSFLGVSKQTPPMYSAIKIGGRKLYDIARKGQTIEIPQRDIEIYSIDLVEFVSDAEFVINVSCKKGTYIRSLVRDIGVKLGCGAVMGDLMRLQSGEFMIENAYKLEEIKQAAANGTINSLILPIDKVLSNFPKVYVPFELTKQLYNGNAIDVSRLDAATIAQVSSIKQGEQFLVYDSQSNLVGIYTTNTATINGNALQIKALTMLL